MDSLRTVTEPADDAVSSSASYAIRIPRNSAPSSKKLDLDDDICVKGKGAPSDGVSCKGESCKGGSCKGGS